MVMPLLDDIHWIGEFIPAAGLSINAFLIKDEYPTLINAGAPITSDTIIDKLASLIDLSRLQYIVLSNADISYAGGLTKLLPQVQQARIITSDYEAFRLGLYGLFIQPLIIEQGDVLNIGKHTLQFYSAPFIGSPGSIFALDRTDHVLFSGEAFSTIVADWQVTMEQDITELIQAYYDTRIGSSPFTRDTVSQLKSLDIRIIAPGHGPVLTRHIDKYIDMLAGGYAEAA